MAMSANREWLLAHAAVPIRYQLTGDPALAAALAAALPDNAEAAAWLARLTDRALREDVSDLHGSHDYRYENIVGKCFLLGLHAGIPALDVPMRFFLRHLETQIATPQAETLTFGKMYAYRDHETVLACYLPFLGYAGHPAVQYVAYKRLRILHDFARQKRYDLCRPELPYPGANKAWKPYILDPALYADGNIAVPSVHDYVLLAGMLPHFDAAARAQAEEVAAWLFDPRYEAVYSRFYYYAPDDPRYQSKAINGKLRLPVPADEPPALLYTAFILSRFQAARDSAWFAEVLAHLAQYQTPGGRYCFPKTLLTEKTDGYVVGGGHMNVGESKKNPLYTELLSTYWMWRITHDTPPS